MCLAIHCLFPSECMRDHEQAMNLKFLGTSAGVPTKNRNVSGVALRESKGKGWYLIDCGEGTQHQVLHTKLSFHSLKAIFITHVHGDHCYGLPGILASAGMGGRKAPLTIVAPAGKWLCKSYRVTFSVIITYVFDRFTELVERTVGCQR